MLNYYNLHKHIAKYLQGLKNDRFETNKKQEAHGPHRSPEKNPVQILIISLRWLGEKEKTLLTLWEFIGSSFGDTWIPFTQRCFVPRLVEFGPVVLENKIFLISSMYFH